MNSQEYIEVSMKITPFSDENAEIFETASDLTLNFGGTLNVSQMIVGNGIAASVYGTFTLTGTLQGEITAKTDSVITISNHLLTNDGTVLRNLHVADVDTHRNGQVFPYAFCRFLLDNECSLLCLQHTSAATHT